MLLVLKYNIYFGIILMVVILFTAINSVLHVPRNWSIALTYVQGTCYIILASQPGEQW